MSGASALPGEIQETFVQSGIVGLAPVAFERMSVYVELLLRWNKLLNLTAVRAPRDIIRRHLVESAFAAQVLPAGIGSLMDYGSGAGLPGIVVALCRPEIRVTLAEAHGRKASFLREAVRSLDIECEVFDGRVEAMPAGWIFHAVTMRAVEKMDLAIPVAARHAERYLVLLTTESLAGGYRAKFSDWEWSGAIRLPNSDSAVLCFAVPRGTVDKGDYGVACS